MAGTMGFIRWATNAPVLTPGTTTNAYQYRPVGKNANMSTAYDWNVTIPASVPVGSAIRKVIPDDMVLVSTNTMATGARYGSIDYTIVAISLKASSMRATAMGKDLPGAFGQHYTSMGASRSENASIHLER